MKRFDDLLSAPGPVPDPRLSTLTDREREVLRHLCTGRTSKEIAPELGILPRAVDQHVQNICRKIGAPNKAESHPHRISGGWEGAVGMSPRTILTLANGRGIDLLNPRPEDIDWTVIAEHLAKENRYNGATPGIAYSVGQHSVEAADAALHETGDRLLAGYLLCHDCHEHTLKDDTTPKKRALAELAEEEFGILAPQILDAFARLTDRHDVAIHAAAGLPWPPTEEYLAAIKHWDLRMFVTEWRDFMRGIEHPNWEPYRDIDPLPQRLTCWDWIWAKAMFIARTRQLLPALNVEAA